MIVLLDTLTLTRILLEKQINKHQSVLLRILTITMTLIVIIIKGLAQYKVSSNILILPHLRIFRTCYKIVQTIANPTTGFPHRHLMSLCSRVFSHSSFLAPQQDNLTLPHHYFGNIPVDLSWPLQTYNPINYKDENYDPKSKADQIVDPIAREIEKTRLWWSANFKKEGWNRILNKPSKPANVSRSIWQTVAYNHFMELTLLSQSSVENFIKANNNTLKASLDDDARTVVIIHPLQEIPFNNESAINGQSWKYTNNLYFPTLHEWYIAWKFYIDLVLILYPHRLGEMHGYISILSEFAKDLNLQAVMWYDRDRRIKLVERRGSTLLDREPSIEGRHFTAAAARVQYIPKYTNSHNRSSNFKSSKTIFHEGIPICREFNRKKGCKRDICRYQHVCFSCRLKSYRESSCYRLHPSKPTQQQNLSRPNNDAPKS